MSNFKRELRDLINKYSKEHVSDTPDFIMMEYLNECLHTFNKCIRMRNVWYGYKGLSKSVTATPALDPNEIKSSGDAPITHTKTTSSGPFDASLTFENEWDLFEIDVKEDK